MHELWESTTLKHTAQRPGHCPCLLPASKFFCMFATMTDLRIATNQATVYKVKPPLTPTLQIQITEPATSSNCVPKSVSKSGLAVACI